MAQSFNFSTLEAKKRNKTNIKLFWCVTSKWRICYDNNPNDFFPSIPDQFNQIFFGLSWFGVFICQTHPRIRAIIDTHKCLNAHQTFVSWKMTPFLLVLGCITASKPFTCIPKIRCRLTENVINLISVATNIFVFRTFSPSKHHLFVGFCNREPFQFNRTYEFESICNENEHIFSGWLLVICSHKIWWKNGVWQLNVHFRQKNTKLGVWYASFILFLSHCHTVEVVFFLQKWTSNLWWKSIYHVTEKPKTVCV